MLQILTLVGETTLGAGDFGDRGLWKFDCGNRFVSDVPEYDVVVEARVREESEDIPLSLSPWPFVMSLSIAHKSSRSMSRSTSGDSV